MVSWDPHHSIGWCPWNPEKPEVIKRNSWALRRLSGPADHPQTPERGSSLHPKPHSSCSFVPRKEALGSWAQVPLAAWLSCLCLEQGINLSPDRGKGKGLRPAGSEEGEKGQGALALLYGGRAAYSPPFPWLWTDAQGSVFTLDVGQGFSHQTGFSEISVQ